MIMRKSELYAAVIKYFEREMPVVDTELEYGSTFQLLVAVVLSAQCTDKRVNMVTPRLFADYPTAEVMAEASEEVIFEYIKTDETPNLINLAGRASNASGNLGSFSGYLEVDEVELKTSAGMTEAEKNNFISLLHSGIII